jgi:hypothetical protein
LRSNEGTVAVENHCKLRRAFQEDAYALSSRHKLPEPSRLGVHGFWTSIVPDTGRVDHIDFNILSLFQQSEFHSVCTLAQEAPGSWTRVYTGLIDVLEFSL